MPAVEAVTARRLTWVPWAALVLFFAIAALTPLPPGLSRSGAYTIRDYMRSGTAASIALLVLTGLAAFFYWPLLGHRP